MGARIEVSSQLTPWQHQRIADIGAHEVSAVGELTPVAEYQVIVIAT